MNILHISTPLSWRGGEQQLAYLASELRIKDHDQYFVCTATGAVEEFCIENEFPFFGIQSGIFQMISNAALVKRICIRYSIDIIHTHDSKAHTIAYISALQGNKISLVVSRRVDFPVGKSFFSRQKYNHSSVKAIICVSKAIREITGKSITNKSLLRVVYDGIETNIDIPYKVPDIKAMFKFPKDSIIVGNVAALAPHKDYFTWLDTAAILKEKNPLFRFLIVGDGPQREEIFAYIKHKQLSDIVIATGFREDAKELIWGFDIFLNTSETEGLGSSLLDAFVRRVPVVATEAGGIPEIVIDESTGLLAPVKNASMLADRIMRLIQDVPLTNRIIENAFESVKQFDKSIMADKTLEIYRQVKTKI